MIVSTDASAFHALGTFAVGLAPWVLPAIFAGGSFLAGLFGNRNKNQQGTSIPEGPFKDWLTTGMLPASGGGGGGGSSRSTTNMNQTETRNLLTMPVIAPEFLPLINMARGSLEQRFRFPKGISPEEEAQGILNTNRTFDVINQSLGNKLQGMGVSQSPAGAYPTAVMETGRGQAISQWLNSIPELARQRQNEDIQLSQGITQALGLGQRQTGTIKTTGSSTTQGSTSGGGGGGGPRFDPSGPMNWLQMQQQAQNQPNMWDRLLPILGLLLGSGAFGNRGAGSSTGSTPGYL